jgi:Spy/CpxP family protein refolding chaperone
MKKLFCLLLLVALAGPARVASAQQDPASGLANRLFPAIGRVLTDDQRESLRQIMVSERAQLLPLEQRMRTSRQALINQIVGGDFNEDLVRQYADQSAQAETELTVIFAKAFSQMQPPLSAQQISQLKNFQPARSQGYSAQGGPAPASHMKLPPALPRDTNDLPVVQ